ncbi:relaxase domain-containing protein [Nostoc ellipsosporum NOK]|nr:relaxase domain-containing protein [Nostoc ellipsosporum NOK]
MKSVTHAEEYFKDSLSNSNYYINRQEQSGFFKGKIAQRLGILGPATRHVFSDLCRNTNPNTGDNLTQRTAGNRTVYYDINFHCPKSLSIASLIYGDTEIIPAFDRSVDDIMLEIEADSQARVRRRGKNENRLTGELTWSDFLHLTSRPIDDVTAPDPHVHKHCIVQNVTWDNIEKVYKAGQFQNIKRDMPYYQERFYKLLSDRLIHLGYKIRKTATAFELDGIPQEAIDLFSKRTAEVTRIAKERNIKNEALLDQLGAKTRKGKNKDLSIDELKLDWQSQLRDLSISQAATHAQIDEILLPPATPLTCLNMALLQRFERTSVASERRILANAYRHSLGYSETSLESIDEMFKADSRIIRIKDGLKTMCTTMEVLAEEQRMVQLAQSGKGAYIPLYHHSPVLSVAGDQAAAVTHVLTATDQVSIIQGGAGTGKTTTLKELALQLAKVNLNPLLIAPTANASRGELRDQGFDNADTVARFIADPTLQETIKDGMLIVDEAGLLGVRDMKSLLQICTEKKARLVLVGDTRQHSSVVRGDALRILNTVAGIKAAEVNKIYRQRTERYRKAVEDIAAGNINAAFHRLEQFNAITELDTDSLTDHLVNDYMSALERRKSALIVSPTHHQGEIITDRIRAAMRDKGLLGGEDKGVIRYINMNYTQAEKMGVERYNSGMAVQFSQSIKGAPRGSLWLVERVKGNRVMITSGNERISLPLDKSDRFTVYRKTEISLAIGDSIMITRGGFEKKGKRLNNGQMLNITSFTKDGDMVAVNSVSKIEYLVGKDFGHINHAYTMTSHASQGKTVDEVFICQPASTFAAANMKQFYVSISRARDGVHIYTDDKEALLDHVSQLGNRQSAHELIDTININHHIAINRSLKNRIKPFTKASNLHHREVVVTQNAPTPE